MRKQSQALFFIGALLASFVGEMSLNGQGVSENTGVVEKKRLIIFIHGFKGDAAKGTNVFETFFGGIYDAFCKSKQLPDLKRDISYLDQLDNEWTRIGHREYPKIFAAYEKKEYLGHIIVPKDSIFSFLKDAKIAVDKNHVDMVKPADTRDIVYRWVKDKIRDIRNGIDNANEAEDKQNKSSFNSEAYLMRPILQLLLAPNEDIGVKFDPRTGAEAVLIMLPRDVARSRF